MSSISNVITVPSFNLKERVTENLSGRKVQLIASGSTSAMLAGGAVTAAMFGGPIALIAALAVAAIVALVAFLASLVMKPKNVTVESTKTEEVVAETAKEPVEETVPVQTAPVAEPVVTEAAKDATPADEWVAPFTESEEPAAPTPVVEQNTTPETVQISRFQNGKNKVNAFVKAHPHLTLSVALAAAGLATFAGVNYALSYPIVSDAVGQVLTTAYRLPEIVTMATANLVSAGEGAIKSAMTYAETAGETVSSFAQTAACEIGILSNRVKYFAEDAARPVISTIETLGEAIGNYNYSEIVASKLIF